MTKSEYALTDKECIVLQYFIENESHLLEGHETCLKSAIIYKCKDGKKHFLAYPAKIEKDKKSHSITISKRWAGIICKSFYEKGILDFEEHRPPRQKNLTEYYYLNYDIESFKRIFRYIMANSDYRMMHYFLSLKFFQDNLNELFIKNILHEKKVEMRRSIDVWDWEPSEARSLFKHLSQNQNSSFEEYILLMFRERYFQDKNISLFPPTICFHLPVLTEDNSNEQIKLIKQTNQETFNEHSLLEYKISGIIDHYNRLQKNMWIIPLLSLIQSSPKALEELLYGDWKINDSYDFVFSRKGSSSFEYPFFRILFAAVSDISVTRKVENVNIESAVFRSKSQKYSDKSNWLLKISTKFGINVYFDGGFSTYRNYTGSENGDIFEWPEESYYWAKAWIDYSMYGMSLKFEDVLDFDALIRRILKLDIIGKFLFSRLPNYIKNILLNYDAIMEKPDNFKKDIACELNRIMFSYNFIKEIEFRSLNLTEYTIRQIENVRKIEINECYPKESKIYSIYKINRLIIEDAYEKLIRKEKRNDLSY